MKEEIERSDMCAQPIDEVGPACVSCHVIVYEPVQTDDGPLCGECYRHNRWSE